MTRRMFVLALAPDKQLEVSAVSVSQVVDASTAALPHLGAAEHERSTSLEVSQGIRSPLTCLLCGLVNPQHALHTPLVAMQEHVWTEHRLPYEDQAQAASVFDGTPEEGCFVWWVPTHGAICARLVMRLVPKKFPRTASSPQYTSHEQHGRNAN
ncbi:MAG TPA: hypothetical protein VFV38_46415 [Ktedonobacteraceae bacterium]|nr:hypothetical protein [Ktedonobacteraceae bacterium]